jgi:photosystem I reaction center subunit VIII
MAAAFLPSILVPIVGLVFPALSMALFFIIFQLMILIN